MYNASEAIKQKNRYRPLARLLAAHQVSSIGVCTSILFIAPLASYLSSNACR